jgi:hypothetical protein
MQRGRRSIVRLIGAAALGFTLPLSFGIIPAGAQSAEAQPAVPPLPAPTEPVILSITGAIAVTNAGNAAQFDLPMLRALPARQLVTETPWTRGLHTFTGVPLSDLLARVRAGGKMLTAGALNDYSADLPADDGIRNGALLAYLFDGAPMQASDRGPLWIVYPFSDRVALRTETFYIRSVWNLESLTVW